MHFRGLLIQGAKGFRFKVWARDREFWFPRFGASEGSKLLALECTEEASGVRDASPKALLSSRLAPKSLLPSYWVPGPLGKVNKCRIRSPHLALYVFV